MCYHLSAPGTTVSALTLGKKGYMKSIRTIYSFEAWKVSLLLIIPLFVASMLFAIFPQVRIISWAIFGDFNSFGPNIPPEYEFTSAVIRVLFESLQSGVIIVTTIYGAKLILRLIGGIRISIESDQH